MSVKILRRAAVIAAVPVAVLAASVLPTDAMESLGLVEVTESGPAGSVTGDCTYSASLPSIGSLAGSTVLLEGDVDDMLPESYVRSMDANEVDTGILSADSTMIGGDFNRIWIAFSGKARATAAKGGGTPVSTSIRCYLRNQAWGSAGATAVGPAAAIAGEGEVYRLAPDPEICVEVSAAFSDGRVVMPAPRCHNL